jgi:hypothetical protein
VVPQTSLAHPHFLLRSDVQAKPKRVPTLPKSLVWLVKVEADRLLVGRLIYLAHRHFLLRSVVLVRRNFLALPLLAARVLQSAEP